MKLSIETLELRSMLSGTPQLIADINIMGAEPGALEETISFRDGRLSILRSTDGHSELWVHDGDALPKPVFRFENSHDTAWSLVQAGELAYFVGDTRASDEELWRTDGTVEGTWMLLDMLPGENDGDPRWIIAVGNTLYFSAVNARAGRELFKTDLNGCLAGVDRTR